MNETNRRLILKINEEFNYQFYRGKYITTVEIISESTDIIDKICAECQYSFMERDFTKKFFYALFNLRIKSFRFVRRQFSATQCQICLPQLGIKEKKRK